MLVTSCNKRKPFNQPLLITADYDTIIQVDSKTMMESNHLIYGINVLDTLDFSLKKDNNQDNFINAKQGFKNDSLIVYVDVDNTNFHTHEINISELSPPPPPSFCFPESQEYDQGYRDSIFLEVMEKNKIKNKQRLKKHYNTLPVFIYNQSDSNRLLVPSIINGELYLIVEALDENNQWKPIEFNNVPGRICINDFEYYQLKPKHFMVSSILKYSGDYKTKMRVKLLNDQKLYYSNQFNGSINYSQFDTIQAVKDMDTWFSDTTNQTHSIKKKLIFLDF
ncbi:hypothetical protein CW732_01405 [Olleya sp. Bg11-27]|nr:hypothetical protein CW732_01405 [Olleya sp. Bg11-27]